jgi:hypothetical protein
MTVATIAKAPPATARAFLGVSSKMANMTMSIMIKMTAPRAGPVIAYDQAIPTIAHIDCGTPSDGLVFSRRFSPLRMHA